MAKHISLKRAVQVCEAQMSRPIKPKGFEERELGSNIVNILFFVCEYENGIQYRMQVFENGQPAAGLIIGDLVRPDLTTRI